MTDSWTQEEIDAVAADFGLDVAEVERAAALAPLVVPVRRTRSPVGLWRPEYVEMAKKLCSQFGATDQDLADFFGVTTRTIHNWYLRFPEFREAVKLAKEFADDRVEQSLYRRAIGYTVETEKILMPKGALVPVVVPTSEYVGPDTTACIFWLKNRRRGEWRDRVDTHINGKDSGPVDVNTTGDGAAGLAGVVAALTATDMEALRGLVG